MTIAEGPAGRLGKLLTELVVVFLGVLIALGADSLWERQREQARVADYMIALDADMASARDQLGKALEATESFRASADSFLTLLRTDGPLPEGSRQIPTSFRPISIPTGTLDALIETGDINLISDERLRNTLIAARASIANRVDIYARFTDVGTEGYLRRISAAERLRHAGRLPEGPLPTAVLRGSPDMIAAYAISLGALGNQALMLRGLQSIVRSLQEALEQAER